MSIELKPYTPMDYLQGDEEIADYLSNAFLDNDPAVFVTALGYVAKARGISQLAKDTGLNRESLYKALSGNTQPKWDTIQRIIKALSISIDIKVAA